MKWTIRVELTPDGTAHCPRCGYDHTPIADLYPEQIGLTREEGQQLLSRMLDRT